MKPLRIGSYLITQTIQVPNEIKEWQMKHVVSFVQPNGDRKFMAACADQSTATLVATALHEKRINRDYDGRP